MLQRHILIAALLWTTVAVAQGAAIVSPLSKRQDGPPVLGLQCPPYNEDYMGNAVRRFSGVFLGDFTSGGGSYPGPLAVQGSLAAPGIDINGAHGAQCPAPIDEPYFGNYGLVVGDQVNGGPVEVMGDAFLANGGDTSQVTEIGPSGCSIITNQGTGILNFTLWDYQLSQASELFAKWYPNMRLNSDDTVTVFSNPDPGHMHFDIFIMDTCDKSITPMYCGDADPSELSDPSAMLLGQRTWSGPIGYTPERTIIINVPVNSGTSIRISTAMPSQGFVSCDTIYNFYPVSPEGRFDPDGSFTLIRDTEVLGGYVMAYNGHVVDGPTGHFSGQVLAGEYSWEDQSQGTHIQPYADEPSGQCSEYFEGCFPVLINIPPPSTSTSELPSSTSTSESSSTSTTEETYISAEATTSSPPPLVVVTVTETTNAPQIVNTETQYFTYTLTVHQHSIYSTPITVTETRTRFHTDHVTHTDYHSDFAILPPIVIDETSTKTITATELSLQTKTVYAPV